MVRQAPWVHALVLSSASISADRKVAVRGDLHLIHKPANFEGEPN